MTAVHAQLFAHKDTEPSCSPRRLRDSFRNRKDQWPGCFDAYGFRIWVIGGKGSADWELIEDIASHCGELPGQYDLNRVVATGHALSVPDAWRDACDELERRVEVAS